MSKRQKVPEGSVWQLRGVKSGVVLHDVTATNAPELLRGETGEPLAGVPVGGCTTVELVGAYPMTFILARVG